MNTRYIVSLLGLLLAIGVAACSAPPPQGPPDDAQAVTAPQTPAAATATPNVVATSAAVATVVTEEEATASAEETSAEAADAPAGASDLPSEITSHVWRLQQYANAGGELLAALESHPITAEWNGGTLRGETGCNTYSGPYVRQENGSITVQQLKLSPLGADNPGCEANDPEVNQEGDYLGALYKSAIYTVREAGQLELSSAEGELLLVFAVEE